LVDVQPGGDFRTRLECGEIAIDKSIKLDKKCLGNSALFMTGESQQYPVEQLRHNGQWCPVRGDLMWSEESFDQLDFKTRVEGSPGKSSDYLMESEEEALRLDLKTDIQVLERQALWAGLKPGMRILDVGCGPGKTTYHLHQLAQLGGSAIGIDASESRARFARANYPEAGLEYLCRDFREPLQDLGSFDFIWVRFVLEYHRTHSFAIVQNLANLLKPGGILCLVDLDHNCLNHYGLPQRLERTIREVVGVLEQVSDFDPFAGRKLYSYLYDVGLQEIDVKLAAHHLIYGALNSIDAFNWLLKAEVAVKNSGNAFAEYGGSYVAFFEEFKSFFADPRRFTYTPLIACRGRKPQS
jgi:2-polyprenyl-3-methyl-5-hydroxy-6-metoxy-1,4-benzoquinol methylase